MTESDPGFQFLKIISGAMVAGISGYCERTQRIEQSSLNVKWLCSFFSELSKERGIQSGEPYRVVGTSHTHELMIHLFSAITSDVVQILDFEKFKGINLLRGWQVSTRARCDLVI
jgi:hypothetical protein